VTGQSRGRVAPFAVCIVHMEMRSADLLVDRQFLSGLALKPLGRFLIGLGLKTDGDGL
jgi:hypothetical protein